MAAIVSTGCILYMDVTGSRGSSVVGQVTSISGPGPTAEKIDITALDSGGWKQFLRGTKDGGDLTFEIFYDPTNASGEPSHTELATAFTGGLVQEWRIKFSDGTEIMDFDGFVTGFEISQAVDEALTASISVGLTGTVVFPV